MFDIDDDMMWHEFKKMVKRYKAMGVRMVCFDNPEEYEGEFIGGSWITAFYTHGISADELPIERFDVPAVRNWMHWNGYYGPISNVSHFDVTDDFGELSNYGYYPGNFPPLQLA